MAIPKIIHQTCKSTMELSPDLAAFVERVAALHPGWEHRLYGDAECRAAVERIFPALLPLYDASLPIQKTDIFRVVAVYGDGGFYLDTDVECRIPLDDLSEFRAVFGEEATLSPEEAAGRGLESPLRVGNYAFGSEPGHPFLLGIIEGMAAQAGREIKAEEDILESTGPGLVTAVYTKYGRGMKDVVVIPNKDRTCPVCRALSCHFGSYAVHAHAGSWRWENLKGRAAPPPGPRRISNEELDALRRDVALRRCADGGEGDDGICLLDVYGDDPPFDGLSTVFGRAAALFRKERDTSGTSGKKVLMAFMPGDHEVKLSPRNTNVIYTTYETTRIPSIWVRQINGHYHRCIVPHGYVKEAFLASGVKAPIEVIHQGFTRHRRLPEQARGAEKGIFRIGFLGVPYRRKNLFKLYQACADLVKEIPGLRLAVHSSVMFDHLYTKEIALIANSSFVEWTQGTLDEEGTSEWYARLSCYAFPSSGEGWSFTPRESLYLGIPTLITDIPVHDELVSSGYYRVIPVSGMDKAEDYWGDCGEWNTVSVKDIREAIADVYSNYGMRLVRALQGAAWIENRWTNESSQQRLLEFMRSL
ncbi:MAG TPA: glycosyltransferase [Thermodesulfobacteriota bacterium]|nr:glycosyltransferase [Thermodesulfobacteriota bacterium]